MPSSVCLFIARWGTWPPWAPLLLRSLELNPTIRFLLLGDSAPAVSRTSVASWRKPLADS